MTSPNGGVNPRQNFVQPGQQNMGSWLGKIFGGIAANRQARDYTQMRADLMMLNHDLTKEQMTHGAALKDFGAESGAKRARKETAWHDKQNTRNEVWKERELAKAKDKGIVVNSANVDRNAGFDKNGMPIRQKRSQVTYPGSPNSSPTDKTTVIDKSGGGNPPPPNPPAGGAATASKPTRTKKAAATPQTPAADVTAPEVKPARKPRAPKAGA